MKSEKKTCPCGRTFRLYPYHGEDRVRCFKCVPGQTSYFRAGMYHCFGEAIDQDYFEDRIREVIATASLKPEILRIISSDIVPEGEIHLRDENGKLVGKITNLKE